jgi:TetR/AcrR family transcriptional regulator
VKTAAPAPRRRLQAAERRQQIVQVAQDVFTDVGYAGARTKDIASRAGLAEAILYRHFASKDELFEAAILVPLEALIEELVEHAAQNPVLSDADEHLRYATVLHEHRMRVMMKIAPLWVVALLADEPGADSFYATKIAPLVDRWGEALRPYFAARGIDADMRSLGLALLGMYAWIGLDAKARGAEADVDVARVSRDLAEFVVLGSIRDGRPKKGKR